MLISSSSHAQLLGYACYIWSDESVGTLDEMYGGDLARAWSSAEAFRDISSQSKAVLARLSTGTLKVSRKSATIPQLPESHLPSQRAQDFFEYLLKSIDAPGNHRWVSMSDAAFLFAPSLFRTTNWASFLRVQYGASAGQFEDGDIDRLWGEC